MQVWSFPPVRYTAKLLYSQFGHHSINDLQMYVWHYTPELLCKTTKCITDTLNPHSLQGFSFYAKKYQLAVNTSHICNYWYTYSMPLYWFLEKCLCAMTRMLWIYSNLLVHVNISMLVYMVWYDTIELRLISMWCFLLINLCSVFLCFHFVLCHVYVRIVYMLYGIHTFSQS